MRALSQLRNPIFSTGSKRMTAIIDLNNREMNAVLSGKVSELDALTEELQRHRQIKDDLMLAYKIRVQTHGC
jgi:hypothetical protein